MGARPGSWMTGTAPRARLEDTSARSRGGSSHQLQICHERVCALVPRGLGTKLEEPLNEYPGDSRWLWAGERLLERLEAPAIVVRLGGGGGGGGGGGEGVGGGRSRDGKDGRFVERCVEAGTARGKINMIK